MTTRRDFLTVGTGSIALAALGTTTAASTSTPTPIATPASTAFVFDQAAYNAVVTKAAKHKLGFGAMNSADGYITSVMQKVLDVWTDDLHTSPQDLHAIGIFYHWGAFLSLNDDIWNLLLEHRVKFPLFANTIAAGKPNGGNPYTATLSLLAQKGANFLICNNALTGIAEDIARILKLDKVETIHRVRTSLIAGSLLVPAGIWAIGAIQEAGFTYQQAS